MKNIIDYEEYFSSGLWHVHTNYTDGKHSIDDLCKFASYEDYPLICFSEHVRKELTYDFSKYLFDVNRAKINYPEVEVLSGIEVKILEDGTLNCSENILRKVDVVFLAEHSWNIDGVKGFTAYINSLKQGLQNPFVQVWAHPLKIAYNNFWNITDEILYALADICWSNDVVIEDNFKYKFLNTYNTFSKLSKYILTGYDLHNLTEIKI